VIKIRYTDLPGGRHAQVQRCGRQTTIFLTPGLPPGQRRDALRRLARISRRGHGPRLRPASVWLAAARDATRSTLRNGLAAVRCHPAGSLLLAVALAGALVCYAIFVSVSIGLIPPTSPGRAHPPAAAPAVSDSGSRLPGAPGAAGTAAAPPPGASRWPAARLARSTTPPAPASPAPRPSSTWSAPGGEVPTTAPHPSPVPTPTPTPSPSPGSTGPSPGDPGGLCTGAGRSGGCVPG
jgi:hypothetical protein